MTDSAGAMCLVANSQWFKCKKLIRENSRRTLPTCSARRSACDIASALSSQRSRADSRYSPVPSRRASSGSGIVRPTMLGVHVVLVQGWSMQSQEADSEFDRRFKPRQPRFRRKSLLISKSKWDANMVEELSGSGRER